VIAANANNEKSYSLRLREKQALFSEAQA